VTTWQRTITFLSPAAPPEDSDAPGDIANQLTNVAYKALVTSMQIDRFQYLLMRWIVCMHVALSVIEHPTFQELMLCCCSAIEPFWYTFLGPRDPPHHYFLIEKRSDCGYRSAHSP
jgi:hypothetical protein